MKNHPLITVIVPIYKVEQYLSLCIESILKQTYTNLEIILVDDGSPDQCGKICDCYAKVDSRIKVIHKINGGLSDARNTAIEIMNGNYLLFIDSDDYVAENHIEHLFNLIDETKADMAIEIWQTFYENTFPSVNKSEKEIKEIITPEKALTKMFYQKDFDTSACAKLYKRELFNGIRYPKGLLYEDLFTTYRLIQQCEKIVYSNHKGYYYLLRNTSIEGAPFKPLKYESCLKVIEQLENDKISMSSNVQKALDSRIVSFVFHILLEIPNESKYLNMRKHLMTIIKQKRHKVIWDMQARLKTRLACLMTFGGLKLVQIFASYGKSR